MFFCVCLFFRTRSRAPQVVTLIKLMRCYLTFESSPMLRECLLMVERFGGESRGRIFSDLGVNSKSSRTPLRLPWFHKPRRFFDVERACVAQCEARTRTVVSPAVLKPRASARKKKKKKKQRRRQKRASGLSCRYVAVVRRVFFRSPLAEVARCASAKTWSLRRP